jgi:molybdenum cofactor cytidylyltransferase
MNRASSKKKRLNELVEKTREKVAGVILAAGTSSRMGSPKQLLPIGKKPLLQMVLQEALESYLDRIVLVLGHKAEDIKTTLGQVLEHPKLITKVNHEYQKGMSTSILAGLREIESTHPFMMILLGDMPGITSRLINYFLRDFLDSGLPMGAFQVDNKRTHPVAFGKALYPQIHNLTGDIGARVLLEMYADRVCFIEQKEHYNVMDVDTHKDYEKLKERM